MIVFRHILLCFQFLTRIPLPRFSLDKISLAATAWCFPVVGGVIGGMLWGGLLALDWLGVSFHLQVVAVLVLGLCLTGALHEDGLADFFDGLGVYDRARALEVMRDSQVGSFGALALLVSFAFRGVALVELGSVYLVGLSLLLAHMGARGMMAVLLLFPRARTDGLAVSCGAPNWVSVFFALAFCVAVFFVLLPWHVAALAFLVAGAGALIISLIAMRRYSGLTGDIYGAGEQVSEILLLIVFATLLPGLVL